LIEMAIAILVFAVLIGAVATMQGTAMNLVRSDRHRSVAANLAAQEMDTLRSMEFTQIPVGLTVTEQDVDGITYTVRREVAWVTEGASAGACDAPPGQRPAYLRVNVQVRWPNMRGIRPVESHTILTPPVGAYDPNTGHIAVKVLDRQGLGEAGIPVSISGPQTSSQMTNSDGCAFFAFLPTGAYTVEVSSAGYVDLQGVGVPTQPASVAVGAITAVSFQYDRAAVLQLTMQGIGLGSSPPPDLAVNLYNTHLLPLGVKTVPGTGNPRTVSDLFPYVDGYEVWIGGCAEADPAGYPGGSRLAVATQPGTPTSATVQLPDVRVTVRQDLGGGVIVPLPGLEVRALGCGGASDILLGQTDASGTLAFALPYGTWDVRIAAGAVYSGSVQLLPGADPGDGDGAWPYDIAVTVGP
jgi:hypothetical protein